MIEHKIKDNEITDRYYKEHSLERRKFIILFIVLFNLGFLANFHVSGIIDSMIKKNMNLGPNCKLNYTQSSLEIFMPGLALENLTIPSSCLSTKGLNTPLSFKKFKISPWGLGFSPFGFKFRLSATLDKSDIIAKIVAMKKLKAFSINTNNLSFSQIKPLINSVDLNGDLTLDGDFSLGEKSIENGYLKIKSSNLKIPPQNIKGFLLPKINIGLVDMDIKIENKKLNIVKGLIGNSKSSLSLNVSGNVSINQNSIQNSNANINLNLIISNEFKSKMSFLDMILGSFKKNDGSYNFKLKGKLSTLKPSN